MRTVTSLFFDININVAGNKQIKGGCYQKPTDTGTLLNFGSCALLQYKRNIIEGTVHMIFRSTSTWELYHEAIITNRQQPSQRNLRIVSIGIIKIVVAFRMRIRKANQKKYSFCKLCQERRECELTMTGVKLSYDM